MAVLDLDAGNTGDMALRGLSSGSFGLYGESRVNAREADVPSAGVYGTSANQPGSEPENVGLNPGVWGDSVIDAGVFGTSVQAPGVSGQSREAPGVFGRSWQAPGVFGGVLGDSRKVPGVWGSSRNGNGIFGESDTGNGVLGEVRSTERAATGGWNWAGAGVAGISMGAVSSPGPLTTGSNPGVIGWSRNDVGVFGVSEGRSYPNNTGVLGVSGMGIGVCGVGKIFAGYFDGDLQVTGRSYFDRNLQVTGDLWVHGFKFAAVRHPDGSHRGLYAMESPECWFEDFGRAKLVRGRAKIKLDSAFAAIVRTVDYHVFLSPEGDTGGLYVIHRNRRGFEVREHQGETSNVTFSYRVVARRKDGKAQRFPKVRMPRMDGVHMDRIDIKKLTRTVEPVEPAKRASKEWLKLRRGSGAVERPKGREVTRKRRR